MQGGDWRAAYSGEPAHDTAGIRPPVKEVGKHFLVDEYITVRQHIMSKKGHCHPFK